MELHESNSDGGSSRHDHSDQTLGGQVWHELQLGRLVDTAKPDKVQATASGHHEGWTLMIDLGVNLRDGGAVRGAKCERDRIFSLAKDTKGKPVTLFVQVAETNDDAVPLDELSDAVRLKLVPHQVSTYVIRDGGITRVARHATKGFEADLDDLLTRGIKSSPNRKLGLSIFSHGEATYGIGGDNGILKTDQLAGLIGKQLKAAGRSSLDLLDFNSCEMGNLRVLDQVGGVCRQVIASSGTEAVHERAEGQNLKAVISDLLLKPRQSAYDYAEDFIRRAKAGANTYPEVRLTAWSKGGTDTLAHYDMSAVDRLEASLDDLGAQLSKLATNQRDLENIKKVFDTTQSVPEYCPRPGISRDLQLLCEGLKAAIESRHISDASGGLRQAVDATLASLKLLVKSHYGAFASGFSDIGGLSVIAPGSGFGQDWEADPETASPLSDIASSCDYEIEHGGIAVDRPTVLWCCENVWLRHLEGLTFPEAKDAFRRLKQITFDFAHANGEAQLKAVLLRLKRLGEDIEHSTIPAEDIRHTNNQVREPILSAVKHNELKRAPHWNQFLELMLTS